MTVDNSVQVLPVKERAEQIERTFAKHGGESLRSRAFATLPEDVRLRLVSGARLDPEEIVVVAIMLSDSSWVLLTTEHISWRDVSGTHSVRLLEVEDVLVDETSMHSQGTSYWKYHVNRAVVTTKTGQSFTIETEPGRGCMAFVSTAKRAAGLRHGVRYIRGKS
ncbi:MAG: hypothetical protein HY816_19540 [Candidatus Wallbacteria bacterium]|nr:hypothetical protein [Candidatus Wallbacteria bacterium]